MASLGERIKARRNEQKLSLGQLAQASDLTKGFLSQVESGRSNPSLASLGRVAQALGVSLIDLLTARNSGSTAPLALIPSRPIVVAGGRNERRDGSFQAIDVTKDGTHFLVDFSSHLELVSEIRQSQATVLGAVLEGTIQVSQLDGTLQVAEGSVVAWDGGTPYAVRMARNGRARLLLFLPSALALPTLRNLSLGESAAVEIAPIGQEARATRSGANTPVAAARGPLSLVAMRAQRLAERKRSP